MNREDLVITLQAMTAMQELVQNSNGGINDLKVVLDFGHADGPTLLGWDEAADEPVILGTVEWK